LKAQRQPCFCNALPAAGNCQILKDESKTNYLQSPLISKGNYENERIEICIEVEEGEKAPMFTMLQKHLLKNV
jgi:hypothetical protein